ncbi:MAG: response regulator [Chromatiales bacterium]|nr:response regulator [Chromatiales bacterium]
MQANAIEDRLRILVVEDDPLNQILCQEMLEALGHSAVVATDGEAALKMLDREKVDLVLMDRRLPGIDGWAATRRWRQQEQLRGLATLPVVGLSGDSTPKDRDSALAAGLNDLIAKPFSMDDLRQIIRRWL